MDADDALGEAEDDGVSDLLGELAGVSENDGDSQGATETGGVLNDEGEGAEEEEESFGLFALLLTILKPDTLPHILLLVLATLCLYLITLSGSDGSDQLAAMGYISMALAYVGTALLSRNEAMGRILRTSPLEVDVDAGAPSGSEMIVHKTRQILKVWMLPLVITGGVMILMLVLFGDDGPLSGVGDSLPTILAFMFVLWSVGQALSFKTSITTSIEGKLKHAELPAEGAGSGAYWPTAIKLLVINLIIGAILILIFVSIQDSEVNLDQEKAKASMLNHILFLFALLITQLGILHWTRPLMEKAATNKRSSAFSLRWGVMVHAFAAWHLMAIYRQFGMASPHVVTMLEEATLMLLTVLLAIWGMTTKGMAKGSTTFTKDNALFWGLGFGFGYAGSIAMVANVLGDVNDVIMAGHAITWVSLLYLHNRALKDHLTSAGLLGESLVSDPSTGSTDDAEAEVRDQSEEEESESDEGDTVDESSAIADDGEVDWNDDSVDSIGEGAEWNEAEETEVESKPETSGEDESPDDAGLDLELLD